MVVLGLSWVAFLAVLQLKEKNNKLIKNNIVQGVSSKFLMGGSPSVPDGDVVRWGGETYEKNPTEAKTAHLMQH